MRKSKIETEITYSKNEFSEGKRFVQSGQPIGNAGPNSLLNGPYLNVFATRQSNIYKLLATFK